MLSLFQYLLVVWYLAFLQVHAVHSGITLSVKDEKGNAVNVKVEAVGCFEDSSSRALRNMYFNARGIYAPDGSKTPDVIRACAKNAYQRGYKVVFGIQYYGECWSDEVAGARYNIHSTSSNCEHGVGKGWANMVYRMSVMSKSPIEGCYINGKEYSEGTQMMIPNDWSSNVLDALCMKCFCSAGQAKDCQAHLYCKPGNEGLCSKWRNATGKCCPVCDCFHDGKAMELGSTWVVREELRCSECTCGADKIAKCTNQGICSCNGKSIPVPDKCCPKCVPTQPPTHPPPETIPVTTKQPPPTFLFFP